MCHKHTAFSNQRSRNQQSEGLGSHRDEFLCDGYTEPYRALSLPLPNFNHPLVQNSPVALILFPAMNQDERPLERLTLATTTTES